MVFVPWSSCHGLRAGVAVDRGAAVGVLVGADDGDRLFALHSLARERVGRAGEHGEDLARLVDEARAD